MNVHVWEGARGTCSFHSHTQKAVRFGLFHRTSSPVSRFSPFAHSSLHSSPQAIRNRTHQFLKCQLRSSSHFKKVDKNENTHRLSEHAE